MTTVPKTVLGSPGARLAAYGLILVACFGGGAAVGAALGPEPSSPARPMEHTTAVTTVVATAAARAAGTGHAADDD